MRKPVLSILSVICLCWASAQAALITYTLENTGGNDYTANFSLTNDTLIDPIEELSIFFEASEYTNLSILSSPLDWDPLVIQPDPFIPDDGFVDWLALSSGLGFGETVSNFVVAFTFTGVGTPGNWAFDIVDPNTFDILENGFASLATSTSEIPLPSAILFFMTGLAYPVMRTLKKSFVNV